VDQTRGAVFSVNNNQASNSHSLSTQCICNTSVMSTRDITRSLHHYFLWWPVRNVKKTSCFLMCSTFGDLPYGRGLLLLLLLLLLFETKWSMHSGWLFDMVE